jgi:DNA-binding transcriptional LysR family regulator
MSWIPNSRLLTAEPYQEDEIIIIAPRTHPLAKKRAVPLGLLVKEPWIVSEKGNPIRDMVEGRFTQAGLLFKPLLEVNLQGSRDAIKSAVASGIGIGFISRSYVLSDLKTGRLRALRVPELRLKRSSYLVAHKNRKSSKLIALLVDFLRSYKKA